MDRWCQMVNPLWLAAHLVIVSAAGAQPVLKVQVLLVGAHLKLDSSDAASYRTMTDLLFHLSQVRALGLE